MFNVDIVWPTLEILNPVKIFPTTAGYVMTATKHCFSSTTSDVPFVTIKLSYIANTVTSTRGSGSHE